MDGSINWLRFEIGVGLILAIFLVIPLQASAQSNLRQEIRALKQRIEQLEEKVQKAQEERGEIKEESKELKAIKEKFQHLSIGGGITGIVQSAKIDDDWESHSPTDGSYSADLEVEVDMDRWGTGFLHLETGDGKNVTDEVCLLTGVNADVMGHMDNDLEVSEALWSFGIFEDKLKLTAGKLDPVTLLDDNLVAKDETTQFLADIFVDQLAMEWPYDYTPGLQLVFAPQELIDFKFAALSADTDWEDLFDHMFLAGEIAVHPEFQGLKGNYRLYGWMNDRHHIEWDEVETIVRSEGIEKEIRLSDDEPNYGFGLSIDQQVTSDITLFARYGWQDDDIAAPVEEEDDRHIGTLICDKEGNLAFQPRGVMEHSWSLGGQITGQRWGRPDDVFGLAIGMAMLNDDYEDYLEDSGQLTDGTDGDTGDELHFEAYYSFFLNEHLAISPDFQIIDNPRGDEDADTVYVGGLRTQISF